MQPIAHIHTNLVGKFGLPRQSGVMPSLCGKITFEPEYKNPEAFRGLEGFSHIWLIWEFSESKSWSPTVRPPRLGGNTRMGVFATRSPFRPNNIGLSVVKLEKIDLNSSEGPTLYVSGVDLMDGTPIFDIKPYLPYSDSVSNATAGFTDGLDELLLHVNFPYELLAMIPENNRDELVEILSHDPRPAYQNDSNRVYAISFNGFDIKFKIEGHELTVLKVLKIPVFK